MHDVAFGSAAYEFTAQLAHTVLLETEHAAVCAEPAAQVLQEALLVAPEAGLALPGGQAVQLEAPAT